MADRVASPRVYQFDELVSSFWKWRLLNRQPPDGTFTVTQSKAILFGTLIAFLQIVLIVVKICQYIGSANVDWDLVVEDTALLCPITMTTFQGLLQIVNRRVLERLVANLEKLFPKTRKEQDDCNLEPYAKEFIRNRDFFDKLTRNIQIIANSMPMILSTFEWAVLGKKFHFRHQFRIWDVVNEDSWLVFTLLYLYGIGATCLYGFHLNNDYVFSALATSQMRMHYRNLGRILSELDARKEEAKHFANLGRLVRYQCALDDLRDDVNEIFNVTIFITFGFTKLSMCLVMFTIIQGSNLTIIPTLIVIFLFLIISSFIRCSNGSALYTISEDLVNRIYDGNWYEGTPRYRRMLVFMMARSNNPVELHGLKIMKIRLETFKELVLEAYQILMFLLNFSNH